MGQETEESAEYTILTTYQCNWRCSYCIIDTHERNETSPIETSDLLAKINKVKENSFVCLTGGEIGLLKPEVVSQVFEILRAKNCQMAVFTNGLFIKRYSSYLDFVEEVHYHCVEDLDQDIELPDLDQEKVIYIIIMTNENINKVQSFLDRYPSIKFKLNCNYKNGEALDRAKAFKVLMANKERIHSDSFKTVFEYSCQCNPE